MPTGFSFAGAKVQRKNEKQAIIAENYCSVGIFSSYSDSTKVRVTWKEWSAMVSQKL